MKFFSIMFYVCISSAIFVMALGLSTYGWSPTTALIEKLDSKNICISGYNSTYRYDLNNARKNICMLSSISYSYKVDVIHYSSSFIGFYVPLNINLDMIEVGEKVTVYYFPIYPNFSVYRRGADWIFILILIAISGLSHYFKVLLGRYLGAYKIKN